MTKKLVYILNYVHETDSQHFVHVFNLLDTLRDRHGWDITILSEKGGKGRRTVFGWEVKYLSERGFLGRQLRLVQQLIAARLAGARLVFVRISLPPTVMTIALGKLLGIKTVYWQSSANFDLDKDNFSVNRRIYGRLMRIVSRHVDRFVTGPETMVDYYHQYYGVARSRLRLLYNDIDTRRFTPGNRDSRSDRSLKVLFVHSFSPSKNAVKYLPAIIEVMNEVAAGGIPIAFDLVGDGPERQEVEHIVRAASPQVHVRLLGALPNTALPSHYAEADLFVMPSYREGMPRALMEAMAAALPAVSTDAGGTRDVVGTLQSRFVVSRDDVDGFGDALRTLLRDADLRRQVGEENHQHVQRYSTQAVADMYNHVLEDMLT